MFLISRVFNDALRTLFFLLKQIDTLDNRMKAVRKISHHSLHLEEEWNPW